MPIALCCLIQRGERLQELSTQHVITAGQQRQCRDQKDCLNVLQLRQLSLRAGLVSVDDAIELCEQQRRGFLQSGLLGRGQLCLKHGPRVQNVVCAGEQFSIRDRRQSDGVAGKIERRAAITHYGFQPLRQDRGVRYAPAQRGPNFVAKPLGSAGRALSPVQR